MASHSRQPKGHKRKLLLSIPNDLFREVSRMADKKGWSRAKYIVHCVSQYTKQEKTLEA